MFRITQIFDYVFDHQGGLAPPSFFFDGVDVDVGVVVGVVVGDVVVGGSVVGCWVVGAGGGGGAVASVSLILVSRSTVAPAFGLCPMTVPAGWELSRSENCGSPKPASLASRIAAPRVRPSKFGTSELPVAYFTVILLSSGPVEPPFGETLIPSPGWVSGSSLLAATVLTLLNFRSSRAFSTSSTFWPTRPSGMVPVLGPWFKVMVPVLFSTPSVPPTGSWAVIVPFVSASPFCFLT